MKTVKMSFRIDELVVLVILVALELAEMLRRKQHSRTKSGGNNGRGHISWIDPLD